MVTTMGPSMRSSQPRESLTGHTVHVAGSAIGVERADDPSVGQVARYQLLDLSPVGVEPAQLPPRCIVHAHVPEHIVGDVRRKPAFVDEQLQRVGADLGRPSHPGLADSAARIPGACSSARSGDGC